MKRFIRLYDEDLRRLVMEHYDVRPSQVTSTFTEEVVGQGMGEHTVPVYYIEIEENDTFKLVFKEKEV